MSYWKTMVRASVGAGVLALGAGCRTDKADASEKALTAVSEQSAPSQLATADTGTLIKVYKDANCGCCNKWVEHLASNGFKVETMDMPDLSLLKQKHGVTDELQSCHTATVDGYVVEGHVPAEVIRKMLKERPSIAGLAVPGMPMGSPGMEGATKERYDVLTFDRAGRTTVYSQQ